MKRLSRIRLELRLVFPLALSALVAGGCSGASTQADGSPVVPPSMPAPTIVATPAITTTPAQNGAVIVSLADTTAGSTIYYTVDSGTPSSGSTTYLAPFLVAQNITVKAIGVAPGATSSSVASHAFAANIASGTLVWSDEFSNATSASIAPNPGVWGYDTGASGWGNAELEDYCAYGSSASPCSASSPNAFVGMDGYLHVVARQPSAGAYTSARLKTQGLFSFQYGRLEFRAQVPEAQGFWPAAWMLGNNIATINWPGCGEMDVLERVNAATNPDFNQGSVHGPGFTGSAIGTPYYFPAGQTAANFHTYGVIWKPGSVSYYVDDPGNVYATFTPASLPAGASWPFDGGQANFILLNLAVGGAYPGSPNASTPFPSEFLIDYVRLYTN